MLNVCVFYFVQVHLKISLRLEEHDRLEDNNRGITRH